MSNALLQNYDVILMNSDLASVNQAVTLACKIRGEMMQNLLWAATKTC